SSLARLSGGWGERLGMGIFFTYLIPPTLLFIPFSRLISVLHLQNSLGSLILIYPTMTIPFCTWLVMGFLRSVPWEIEEQAMIDGYSRLSVILRVAPRLIVPGILKVVFAPGWSRESPRVASRVKGRIPWGSGPRGSPGSQSP